MTGELKALLMAVAEYLGDRPATDREANQLYERVLQVLLDQAREDGASEDGK